MAEVTLTPAEAQELRDLPSAIRSAQANIAKLKRAGLNVDALEREVARLESIRAGLLREFAPRPGARPSP